MTPAYVLSLSCPNRAGIVAAVSSYLFEQHCNILDAQHFDDTASRPCFMRLAFDLLPDAPAPSRTRGASADSKRRYTRP